MPSLNRVQLIGNLGKDPDARFTPTGKQVVKFSLAVSNRWKKDGDVQEYTEWVNIEAWGRLAEICNEYLRKGSLVYIEGRLKTDKYQDDSDVTRYFTKVVIQQMQMLDKKEAKGMIEEMPAEYETE
ncbi:MAG: single-stranded DNA-binding protein [Anaerolineae bacterium]|jgi:single-strand DNA-binding protein|nr:single-stranded DNA-binding protein [Anaerolineae bacterium]MBT3714682.1 single-stranded DNA-binding protein [Anaerolineae bacterium]MBT4312026.1 single-stranded DNA-binding protein [Anaerolineae bacterium]MBT4459251.1 single-stranded DNA-binding protein [Anaerolineae bacterium]MBT4842003.1 single-stranded DNA-binding protein [Anaerolineae bacterium]